MLKDFLNMTASSFKAVVIKGRYIFVTDSPALHFCDFARTDQYERKHLKSISLISYCWLGLTDHSDATLMEKFVSLCAGLHVGPLSCWFVCILQGLCSLTTLRASGCHTAFPTSPRSLRGVTSTPPLANATARLPCVSPINIHSCSI